MRNFLIGLTMIVVGLGAAIVPSQAHAAANDASITNIGKYTFAICKDWGKSGCAKGSAQRSLAPGENSKKKYGWTDTDGFWIPTPCRSGVVKGPRWVKVGGLNGGASRQSVDCGKTWMK